MMNDESHLAPRSMVRSDPLLSRINAAFFALMDGYMHWKYAETKKALFSTLPDVVVELGAGAGANFRYFRPGTKVIALEPNVFMHAPLRRAADKHGVVLDVRTSSAEQTELPSESVDAVVSSLVLCSVSDQVAAVREAKRVLRPGGRLLCIEHVAAPESTFVGKIQRLVFRPWRWFFEGCHTHPDTERTLREAGFSRVEIERITLSSVFVPVRPQIVAICER